MSRSPHSPALRTVALASALLVAGLAAPAAGHAQGVAPERTLLNRIAVPSITTAKAHAAPAAPAERSFAGGVEAEQALLGRTPVGLDAPLGMRVDGERALLVRVAQAEAFRRR